METKPDTARWLVIAIIVASLSLSLLTIVAFNISRGPERLPQQIVRFSLTVGLCVLLYRGANWARWVAGILFALAGLASLLGGVAILTTSMAGLLLFVMGLVYLASALILLFVPTVRAYFGVGNTRDKSMRPELKQFGDLRPADFDRVPVWVACHGLDDDEPWYDDTDEETFRPWDGDVPVDPSDGMFLVRASFSLADGRTFAGFATPTVPGDDAHLGIMQPHLAVGDRFFAFWGGLAGIRGDDTVALDSSLRTDRAQVFPIEFRCDARAALGVASGTIRGFYRRPSPDDVVVE